MVYPLTHPCCGGSACDLRQRRVAPRRSDGHGPDLRLAAEAIDQLKGLTAPMFMPLDIREVAMPGWGESHDEEDFGSAYSCSESHAKISPAVIGGFLGMECI